MNSIILLSWEERILAAVFAGVDGIECFAIDMSSAMQNWLKISDGQGKMTVNGFVKYCESYVCASAIYPTHIIFYQLPILSNL